MFACKDVFKGFLAIVGFQKEGGFPDQSPCANSEDCMVCGVFVRHLDLMKLLRRASLSKGDLFSHAYSVPIHQIYAMAVPRDLPPSERPRRTHAAKQLLCELLDCQRNCLQCLKQIGKLGKLIPKLLCMQRGSGALSSGNNSERWRRL